MSYSLTNPQNSIWLTEKFYTETAVNNICGYVYISNPVNFDFLEKAINQLVKTNDSMRLKLKEENNSCIQYLDSYQEFKIDIIELSSQKDIELKAEEFASIPFKILNNFLFKFVLFKLPDQSGGFIINVHHIISDSWTLGLVAKEVTSIYSNLLNSTYEEEQFPSYINYVKFENEYINSDRFIKDKEYWNEVFNTVPEIASIPSLKNDASSPSCIGKRQKFIISDEVIKSINNFCVKNKISVYNFFMSVYSLYVGRVSNLDDFVIGTPILNRTNFEQKHTMGMFVSTAPLRIHLNHNLSFGDFSKKVSSDTMSILRHQKYPYQSILEDFRKKDSSIPNLYNIVLSYQITKTIEELDNIHYSTDWVFNGNCADELQIHLFDLNDESTITVAYDYKADKYDIQDITDLHNRILTMINQIIINNDILLKDIEIVTPEEKYKILYEFNNTKTEYPHDKTIVELFEEQVEKTPDNIAVVFENQKLTYRELNEKANQLAHYLLSKHISIGDIVCILLDKSLEMIISILGILKVGATFLPIDINYPSERINYIINNSKSNLILIPKNSINNINYTIKTLVIEQNNLESLQLSKENTPITYSTDNIAYIMYTSGSTGNPKGVMVTHKNIVRLVKNNKFINFNPNEHILQTGSIVFDACTFEIWSALLNGYQLFLIKKEDLLSPQQLQKYLLENKISTLWLTAPLFNQLCESNPYMFSSVKNLLTGGDVLSPKHINMLKKACPNLTVINGYGPTENTTFSCCFTIDKEYQHSIPIGKPISNSTAYVISSSGSLCPIGVPGELWVGGDGVARGYLNNEALTHEKFIKNPFTNGIIYKTGDLVKWLSDGNIEFIGRIDNQVKIRGFRVELNEINNTILTFYSIKQSATFVYTINETKYICSYFVSPDMIDIDKLKEYLRKVLPNYMIPHFLIQIDSLPLTINGKIDKKLLPTPSINDIKKEIILPCNKLEHELLKILKSIISNNSISVLDDFFIDLEMDSLTAMKTSALLSKYNITIQDINTYSSIRSLADFISKGKIKSFDDNSLPMVSIEDKMFSFDLTNVLLTGGIGFLGVHILYELIHNPAVSKIYCLIRKKNNMCPHERLEKILDFYFPNDVKSKILNSVIIVEGDFCYKNLNIKDCLYKELSNTITTVIHCGANVKHYGKFEHFYSSNVEGTKNILYFCEQSGASLAHISTTSIGGFSNTNNLKTLDENSINIGQHFNNHVYMITKFLAEVEVLNAINHNLVCAKIFRIGNMMPRLLDNKFQINLYDNAFISRLEALSELHAITAEYQKVIFDITPVDLCCNAIMKILNAKDNKQTIYHVYNPNTYTIETILSRLNIEVQEVSHSEFVDKIISFDNPLFAHLLDDIKNIDNVESKVINNKTIKSLENLEFYWPTLPDSYINNLINLY